MNSYYRQGHGLTSYDAQIDLNPNMTGLFIYHQLIFLFQ